jgi:hypothetical protein
MSIRTRLSITGSIIRTEKSITLSSSVVTLPIDYVIPFVDCGDENWLVEYKKFVSDTSDYNYYYGKPLLINRLEEVLPGKSEFEK